MKTLYVLLLLFLSFTCQAQPTANIESILETVEVATGKREIIHREKRHFEAPNWSKDGSFMIVNSGGKLYRISSKGGALVQIHTGFAQNLNNDHGISPDGKLLVISHYNQPIHEETPRDYRTSTIYTLPIEGGTPKQITAHTPSFWHGWSPDGKTLAFVGERTDEGKTDFDIYTIAVRGGEEIRLTTSPGLDDGPDYSPDGRYIYFNSFRSGRMQIWRMRADGSEPVQLTDDQYSNWFPHPSPDGRYIVYLSYLEDQGQAHPFGKNVKLRLMEIQTKKVRDLTEVFFGGQGTINVPSWSPDSRKVAFVRYQTIR